MKNNTWLTIKIYARHLTKYKLLAAVVFISTVIASGLDVVTPFFYKKFFDVLSLPKGSANELLVVLLIILALNFIHWAFWRIQTFSLVSLEAKMLRDLADTCFRYLHRHSYAFFNNSFVGSLVKRVNWFTRAFEGLTDRMMYNLLPLIINLTVVIIVLFYKSAVLGMVMIGWLLVFFIMNGLLVRYKLTYDIKRSEAESATTAILADTITNQINVKLFVGYGREVKRFWDALDKLRHLRQFTWNLNNMVEAVQGFLMVVLEFATMYYGVILWQAGKFTIGDFVLLQSYVLIVFMKVWDFGKQIRHIYQEMADAEEMTEILKTSHAVIDKPKAKQLVIKDGTVVFDQVNFNYNETRQILKNFNLSISSREKIAFVGPSGAGKTTITRLLLRLYDISGGKILVDGQNIADVKMESLWAGVSYVPQDPILFHRSLMENIRYGRFDATDGEVYKAAKLAHCHEFISQFSEGYNTYVGERGVKLSGGERQRVAIARAILRGAPILIMDEATSSLDSESEHLIQDALANLMKNKTVITVAHRLSTIMKMDRIIVVDNGGIVEEGSHTELLKKENGIYKKLWSIQAGGFLA